MSNSYYQGFRKARPVLPPAKAVKTQVKAKDGRLRIAVRIDAPCEQQQARDLLINYDSLASYVPNIQRSRLLGRDGHRSRVQLTAGTQRLPIRFDLVLEFNEATAERIDFRQVEGNYREFVGDWHLSPQRQGVLIDFQAIGHYSFPVPDMLMNFVFQYQIQNMMQALYQELTRSMNG